MISKDTFQKKYSIRSLDDTVWESYILDAQITIEKDGVKSNDNAYNILLEYKMAELMTADNIIKIVVMDKTYTHTVSFKRNENVFAGKYKKLLYQCRDFTDNIGGTCGS